MAEPKEEKRTYKRANKYYGPTPSMTTEEAATAIKDLVGSKAANKTPTTGRGGNSNFPHTRDDATPEDRQAALTEVLRWTKFPRVQTDEECAERIELYFSSCAERGIRPVWEELALALGCYDRTLLWKWMHGEGCSDERSNLIKMANTIMASYDGRLAVNGKTNPVPYIFRAKNYYGMKDEAQVVLTPNSPLGDNPSQKAIAEKYAELPEE